MAKTLRGLQTNFTSGELTPRLDAHVDINKYKNGLKTALNAIVLSHGPVKRRNGSQYINEVKDSTKPFRLLRFQFNQQNAYILEFGDQTIRFYRDKALVENTFIIPTFPAPSWIGTSAGPQWTVTTNGPNDTPANTLIMTQNFPILASSVSLSNVTPMATVTGAAYKIQFNVPNTPTISPGSTFSYSLGTTHLGADIVAATPITTNGVVTLSFVATNNTGVYLTFNGVTTVVNSPANTITINNLVCVPVIIEVATPYLASEAFGISYVQFGKSLYLVHENHPPAELVWDGTDYGWKLINTFFYPPATDQDGDTPPVDITAGATTGLGITFTASANWFLGGDVGRQIHNKNGNGKASITSVTSGTVVVCDILEDFDSTSLTSGNWLVDLSPIAKLLPDQSGIGVTCTLTSFYVDSARGPVVAITGVSTAAIGVVTAPGHGLNDGDKVEIKKIKGMTQLNNTIWTSKYIDADTFSLLDANNLDVDTLTYTAYTSGGTSRLVNTDVGLDVFRSTDLGKYVLINNGIGQITKVVNPQTVTVELQKTLNSVAGTPTWSLEEPAWSDDKGYPRTVAIHQQRQWFGGTDKHPQSVYGSASGVFDNLGVGADDSDAIQFDVSTAEVNEMQWMRGINDKLTIGTFGSEMTVDSGGVAGPITNKTVNESEIGQMNGSLFQQPLTLESELLYVQRSGQRINSFKYNFEINNYKSDDLLFLAEHLPKEYQGIKEITYAHDPDRLIYAVCNSGDMIIGTYYSDQQVMAWTRFETDGIIETVQTINTTDGNEVWLGVARIIGGATKRYIERMDDSNGTGVVDGFSDSYLVYNNPLTITSITSDHTNHNTRILYNNNLGYNTLKTGDTIKIFGAVASNGTELNSKTFAVTILSPSQISIPYYDVSLEGTFTSLGQINKLITSVSGLSHLEGKTVEIKADGAYHANKVVTSGVVTLDSTHFTATVGIPYTTRIVTLNREIDIGMGSEQGQPQRFVKPIFRLYQSALPMLNGEFLPARDATMLMDTAVPLITGDVIYGSLTWSTVSELTIELSRPYPLTLLGIFGSMDAGNL